MQCSEKYKVCNNIRKTLMPFDYIPIGPQLKLLVKSRTFCHELLTLWRNKDRWLQQDAIHSGKSIVDFWDGTKFQEVKDFWNPSKYYELLVVCNTPSCKKAYTAFSNCKRSRILDTAFDATNFEYRFLCSECRQWIVSKKRLCQRDPRNIALLVHWDGFQTSRTTQKSCGVVEIMILNSGKYTSMGILPVSFIPSKCKKIMKASGDVFGTCLEPLVNELESLYIEGLDVEFNYPIDKIFGSSMTSSKQCKIRPMVMMVTGDHPAQCKIGLFKHGGQEFCRRDKAQATLVRGEIRRGEGRYIFDENRYQARYKPTKRSTEEMLQALEEAKRSCTQMEKEAWKKAGLSGSSILWRLYDLYGFDLPIDLVYDAMHTLSLNLFKKYIFDLFEDASPNLKKEIDDAVCTVTNLVPTSIRFGRWPNSSSVYHDSFKAEENQKFMQWCLPYILRVVSNIPLEMEVLGLLLIDIAHNFYNFSRDHGWSFNNIEATKKILQSWRVRKDGYRGATSSPLEHVAGNGELLDDVLRHGLHDRFWCYIFERLVKAYSSIKTNNLNNEASFVQFYLRSGFTRVFQALQKDLDGLLPSDRLIQELHASLNLPYTISQQCGNMDICVPSHKRGISVVSSVEKAKSIWSSFLTHGENKPCLDTLVNKGIAISTKRLTYREADANEVQYLKSFWAIDSDSYQINNLTVYNKVFFKGEVYKVGEYVVVKVDGRAAPSHYRGHWKARIKSIFSMQHKNKIMVFFSGEYYKQCIVGDNNSESLSIDRITSMNNIEKRSLPINWDSIRPIPSLLHKFIPLPLPKSQKLIAYEIKDLKIRDTLLHEGCIGNAPLWLGHHDIVKVRIENQESFRFQLDMDCSQSFLDSLLSKPREEALRLLDLWRASQPKDLCIEKVHEVSTEAQKTSMYAQLFRAPPLAHRDKSKLYGKEFLRIHCPDQVRVRNGNHSMVNEWFTRIGPIQDLRNNPKEKEKVSSIIKENAKNVQTIIVDGIAYKWEEDDIYAYAIKSLAAKRKWRKQKSTGSNTSSTTNSIVDNIITKSDSHNIEEEMQELENCASVLKMLGSNTKEMTFDQQEGATEGLQV
ncbi:hypothetical protein L7F22_023203 [Adiantum nelumboides]|nr:hypothetical protein [Adiantum nelumboides]